MNTIKLVLKLSLLASIGLAANAAATEEFSEFWLSPQANQQSYDQARNGFEFSTTYTSKQADRSDRVLAQDHVISSFVSTATTNGSFSVASSYSNKEYSTALGASFGAFSFYTNAGRGESYSHNLSNYSGLDPFSYHGGNLVDYRYSGASLGYSFSSGSTVQFGQTTVEADRLEDRRSSFIDISNNRFFARYTHIERGEESVGFGVDAGVNIGKFNIAYQQLSNDYDVSTKRIRFNWNRDHRNRFWVDFSNHDNARLNSYSDSSVMLSWQHAFGRKALVSYATEESGTKKQTKNKGLKRGLFIGGAVAAGALIASSGSDSQDTAERQQPGDGLVRNVQAQHDAASGVLNAINPRSIRENREFGGYIYQLLDGSYASTEPIRGEAASLSLPAPQAAVPAGTFARASYHTHAAFDPAFDNENFSPTDLESDRTFSLDGYLGTPGGAFKYHEVSTGNISTLGRIATGG